jgi:hypothetical protein
LLLLLQVLASTSSLVARALQGQLSKDASLPFLPLSVHASFVLTRFSSFVAHFGMSFTAMSAVFFDFCWTMNK